MGLPSFKRLPKHIAIIPDGNRRWAQNRSLGKHEGYDYGILPGIDLYEQCVKLGVEEITYFGFTQDNTKRPEIQRKAFVDACIKSVEELSKRDAELLVVGNTASEMFPKELLPYTTRSKFGAGGIKVNFLVNYGWQWDLTYGFERATEGDKLLDKIASNEISRVDLLIRWGGRRRLSGMLPVQTVYTDIYVLDDMWPDYKPEQFYEALEWYQDQDVTLGG